MGLAAIERGIPADKRRPEQNSLSVGLKLTTARSLAVVEVPALALLLMVFAISVAVTPDFELRLTGWSLPHPSLDPFFVLTGIPCLFCGMTRSFLSMGSLDIGQAFVFHPLGPFLYIGLALTGAGMAFSIASRRRIHFATSRGLRRQMMFWVAFVFVAAWVLKLVVWSQAGLL